MKNIKLAFLFLVLHLNISAMQHTHQSSSASPSRQTETVEPELKFADEIDADEPVLFAKQQDTLSSVAPSGQPELTAEQEIKIANETREKTKIISEKSSKLNAINYFENCLNQHLIKDLSNLVLEYADINNEYSQYYCSKTIKKVPILTNKIIQIQDGSLISHEYEGKISILNYKDIQCSLSESLKKHTDPDNVRVNNVTALQDGSLVVTLFDHKTEVWHFRDGQYFLFQTLEEQTKKVHQIIELKDSSLIFNLSDTIELWKLNNGKYHRSQIISYRSEFIDTIFANDNVLFGYSGVLKTYFIWTLIDGQYHFIRRLDNKSRIQFKNNSLAFSYKDNVIYILTPNENNVFEISQTIKEHTDDIRKVIELQDGSLASCSNDHTIRIWKLKQGKYFCFQVLTDHKGPVYTIIELKDGSLASYSYLDKNREIKIWQKKLNGPIPDDRKNKKTCVIS